MIPILKGKINFIPYPTTKTSPEVTSDGKAQNDPKKNGDSNSYGKTKHKGSKPQSQTQAGGWTWVSTSSKRATRWKVYLTILWRSQPSRREEPYEPLDQQKGHTSANHQIY